MFVHLLFPSSKYLSCILNAAKDDETFMKVEAGEAKVNVKIAQGDTRIFIFKRRKECVI